MIHPRQTTSSPQHKERTKELTDVWRLLPGGTWGPTQKSTLCLLMLNVSYVDLRGKLGRYSQLKRRILRRNPGEENGYWSSCLTHLYTMDV